MLTAYDPSQQRTVIQESNITADKLEDYVGKEVAKKLVDQSPDEDMDRSLAGLDLRVGGEGMKGFYDNMLPKEIGKYVKPFGGGVEKTTIIDPKGGRDISFQTKDQAEKWASDPVNTGDHEAAVS